MSPDGDIGNSISRLRKRVRLLLIERYSLFGASAGAAVTLAIVLLSTRYDELLSYWLWAGIILLGAMAGGAWAMFRKLDDLTVAIAADKRADLRERLSTAVALREQPDEMVRALISDANQRASALHPSNVFRRRFGAPHAVFGMALILLLGVIILPQLPAFQSKTRQQEVTVMKREGRKLVKVAKEIRNVSGQHQEIRKLANKLQILGKKMETGRMTRKQAMLKTQRLTKELQKEQDRLAKLNSQKKSMEEARAQMRKASADLTKRMAGEIAKKENIPPQDAMKQVPSDKRLAELARKEGPLAEPERKELEQAIQKYTDPDNKSPIPAELGEAMAKLAQNGNYQKAMELMQQVAKKLGNPNLGQIDKKMLQEQMNQLAKALSKTDLDKLAKQLQQSAQKLANMSPQELKELLKQAQMAQKLMQKMHQAGGT